MPNERAASPRNVRWLAVGIAIAVLVLAVTWVLFVPAADWLAHHDVGSATGSLHETAVDNARGRLLTLGAGLFAAGALIFTAQNFVLSQRTVELSRRTFELTEQGQVTDRYTKAIEQLGSDKLDIRIGGVYALERVTHDSERDHPTVMEVLTAFIREHSHEPWPSSAHHASLSTRPDVQAALTVVGRRDPERDVRQIDLAGARLIGANLDGAYLVRADLQDADLTSANLSNADLTAAYLRKADLHGAFLAFAKLGGANLIDGANLQAAYLVGAYFTDEVFGGAKLPGANLASATIARVDLTDVDLTDANLTGVDLTVANPGAANLAGAVLDNVKWPAGSPLPPDWELDPGSGRLKRSSDGSTPTEAD
jgi:uncharacterized protein YjbI with pentapeptide repeats